jgi:hypothetical protein
MSVFGGLKHVLHIHHEPADSGDGPCAQDINSPARKFSKPRTMLGTENSICVRVFAQDLEEKKKRAKIP